MSKGWDSATLKKLKALTGKGLSTAEIGKRLGISKNAVVGKLNRLGWNSKAGGIDTDTTVPVKKVKATVPTKKAKAPVAKPVTPAKAKVKVAAATPRGAAKQKTVTASKKATPVAVQPKKSSGKNLAIHQRIIQHSLGMSGLRQDQCRWPMGDPDSENFHFCGAPVFVGKPYCYEHCKMAYQFTPPKKK